MTTQLRAAARHATSLAPLAFVALFVAWAPPARADVPVPDAPTLYLYDDATFTRTSQVLLTFSADFDYPSSIVEYRTSNDPATTNGVLTNGSNLVGGNNWWTLAAGADGPRTIYGQTHHANGAWSPVGSLTLELATADPVRFVIDSDPLPSGLPETDGHDQFEYPDDWIAARGVTYLPNPHRGFIVGTVGWAVSFTDLIGAVAPGTYTIDAPNGNTPCSTRCGSVSYPFGNTCQVSGTITIESIAFTDDNDIETLDADFRLLCWNFYVVAGSIRYGSDRDVIAIDQSTDAIYFGETVIGDGPHSGSVTFTNKGTAADTLGTATIASPNGGGYSLTSDSCSGATLDPGETCTVEVTFEPIARDSASFKLEIPDGTARQARRVVVSGYGVQPVTLALDVPSPPPFGPAPTTIHMTIFGGHDLGAGLFIDGLGTYVGSGEWTTTNLSNPTRTEVTLTTVIGAGAHELEATFIGGDYYLPAAPVQFEFELGVGTSLELKTVTDDGVASGESADLLAQLTTGGPVTGTLRIRDGIGGTIIATQAVSGTDPSLTKTVTKGVGTHAFEAEFIPGFVDIQEASDDYDLVVVNGIRPETTMDDSPLTSWYWQVLSEFDSPTPGATLECRLNFANWVPCTSPWWFSTGPPGTATIKVRATLSNGLADRTPATREWTFDPNLTGTVAIKGGAAFTTSTAVSVSTQAPAGSSPTHVRLSNDGSTWMTRAYSPTQSWTLTSGNGSKTVWTEWRDSVGNWSSADTDTIVLDNVDPTATAPGRSIAGGKALTGGRLVVRVAWTGADSRSGIARYELERSEDGGAWGSRASTTSASREVALEGGHSFRFRVRAIDKAGNVGAWVPGATFAVKRYGEGAATFTGTWSPVASDDYVGDHAMWSATAGSKVRFTFSGRSFGWLTDLGPMRGRVAIYVNGAYQATVDLYADDPASRTIAWSKTWGTSATRMVEIRVLSTPGRQRVDIDGFWVLT